MTVELFFFFQALVHVSTAYCNCERERVEETVYAPPAHPEHVVTLVQTLPDELVDRITPDLVGEDSSNLI